MDIDIVTFNIFWVDQRQRTINVASLKNPEESVLELFGNTGFNDIYWPVDIAVNMKNGECLSLVRISCSLEAGFFRRQSDIL